MMNFERATLFALPFFAVFSVGCAHPQALPVTSTAAAVAAPPVPAASPAPQAQTEEANADDDATEATEPEAPTKAAAKPDGPMSFEALTAALGSDEKLSLDINRTTEIAAGKGLSSDGYTAVAATHQAVAVSSTSHAGDIKVGAGLTAAAVRSGVHEGAGRLRACYERGLAANTHLAGRVTVSFSVDARGAVSGVQTDSDVIPGDVLSCVRDAFEAMTFSAPKTAPVKVVYPVDFNKDS
jgi:hypothetical protein